MSQYSTSGANFGEVKLVDKTVSLTNISEEKTVFDLPLENIAQCVMPQNNKNEVELQFQESDTRGIEDDNLVQLTFHFPHATVNNDDSDKEDDDEPADTIAEAFHKNILDAGIIQNLTGNVIVEFTKEQGTFVQPRGRYTIQMSSTFLRMAGAQYDYKIMYSDIQSLFLLPKPDEVRMYFVISLLKPIRQGNQKYQHLVLETHKMDETIDINLTEEEIASKYDGQLTAHEMTMPLCNLVAKCFKVLSQNTVFIPKTFVSVRESHCIKCSLKANEGYLYPLAKSFVFVHKPTVIIKFDDVEFVRFERYHPSANSATKNFDIVVAVKSSAMNLMGDNGGSKEYAFLGIERIEFHNLHDFFVTKKMVIKGVDANSQSAMYNIDKELGLSDDEGKPKQSLQLDEIDSEEEDDDYDGGSDGVNSASDDDSGSDSGDEGTTPVVTKKTKSKATLSSPSKKKPREGGSDSESDEEEAKGSKKGSKKKDKNAPKGATTSYMFYVAANRATLKSEHPDLSFGELAKLLGEKWKTLSSEEKQPYEEQALQDKERYKNDMNNYVPPSGKDDDKKKKRKVDPNAPKGASSAYILFGSDARADIKEAHPEFSMIEVTKEIGARWKAISEADKAVYENMAKEDKKRYDMQMAQYKETGEFTAVEKPSSGLVSSSQSSTIKPDPEGVQEQTDNSAEDGSAAPVKTEVKTEPETASEVVKMEQE